MASLMSQLVPLTEDQSIEELNLALDSQRDLRHSIDPSGPDFGAFLDYEGQISYLKYKKTDDLKNLDEALRVTRAALETNTAPGYKLGVIQCRLAGYLTLMMADTGNQQYAKEALTYGRLALKSLDIACEQWWAAITNLSELFQDLGPSSIVLEELDEVIEIYLTGLDMARRRTNYSSRYFGGLSALLGLRYKQTHSPQDLEKSIDYGYEAIDMIKFADTVTGEYDWLSAILLQNYQSTHSSSSLSEALRISYDDPGSNSEARRATRVNSGAFCNRGIILSELSKRCRDRDPTEALKLLDEAIFNGNSAIALLKPEDDHYPHVLNMMGAWHAERMQVANNPEFGEEGIRVLKRALALRPRDHPEYARVLGNLAHIRQVQFQILQDRAIKEVF
ncbi:hypothetical protein TGAMA5MH_04535 [Trichoderma gamsii]|uniref:MalT-like TPR region domain-containing protein n=1 Tax=Trichoderma gamsii TaxID=398673 RepID=A0A2K0TDG0_9HYPO|nr:hypothetical protein TGAMA5MH_04535 [Trichoderma gamsii]